MAEPAVTSALPGRPAGVLTGLRDLARESADLFRQLAESSQKTGRISSLLIMGAGTVLIGSLLLCQMVAQLLAWAMPEQPIWMWYGAVGVPVFGAGIVLAVAGRSSMKSLHPLQQQSVKVLRDATETAKHVEQTVESARQSLHDTAESLRETFDVKDQFNKRPWLLVAGAASLGYIGSALLHDGRPRRSVPNAVRTSKDLAHARGIIARMAQQLTPEVVQLRGLALGALLGMVRDLATKTAPQRMERELVDVINGITVKMGGTPARDPAPGDASGANGTSRTNQ